jgi:two-component sensor histidine kinase
MLVRSIHAELAPNMRAALELVVSELVSNAVRHAETPLTLRLRIGPTIRVEVADGSAAPPVLRQPTTFELGGRGLVVVDAYADRWGHEPIHGDGKLVWAELDR